MLRSSYRHQSSISNSVFYFILLLGLSLLPFLFLIHTANYLKLRWQSINPEDITHGDPGILKLNLEWHLLHCQNINLLSMLP